MPPRAGGMYPLSLPGNTVTSPPYSKNHPGLAITPEHQALYSLKSHTTMKRLVSLRNKFITIQMIMNEYQDAFEGVTNAMASRDKFISNTERISELLSLVDRPYTEIYHERKDASDRLVSALDDAIGIAISVAAKIDNAVAARAMQNYRLRIKAVSFNGISEISLRVIDFITANAEEFQSSGFSAEQLSVLQELSGILRDILQSTSFELSTRKTAKTELSTLASENRMILKVDLDNFVKSRRKAFPALYNAYMTERSIKRHRRKSPAETALCEISGTVTDSATGQPLANAVINLLTPETIIITDEDGVYVIEELAAGTYTVSCHLAGYEVPAGITVTAAAGESPVVDFALVPAQQQAAA